jgi:hypothetical protein
MCTSTSLIPLQLFELSAIVVATTQVIASFLLTKNCCTHQRSGCCKCKEMTMAQRKSSIPAMTANIFFYLISFWSQKYFELSPNQSFSVCMRESSPETWIGPEGFKLNLDGGINTRALISSSVSFRRRWFATWFSTVLRSWGGESFMCCTDVYSVSWVVFSMWLASINPYWLLWWRRHRFAVDTKLVEQVYNCTVCHV